LLFQLEHAAVNCSSNQRFSIQHPLRLLPVPVPFLTADDLLPLVERTNNLEVAAPLSGTSLFADCWCIPAAAAGG
jgi:hypothetical protein